MGFSYVRFTSHSFTEKKGTSDAPSLIRESPEAGHPDQRKKPSYDRRSRHSAARYEESPNGQILRALLGHLELERPDAAGRYALEQVRLAAWELLP